MSVRDFLRNISYRGRSLSGTGAIDLGAGGWRDTYAPEFYAKLGTNVEDEIRRGGEQERLALTEGAAGATIANERRLLEALAEQGVNPTQAGFIMAEQGQELGRTLGGGLATSRARESEAVASNLGGIGDAIHRSVDYQDQLDQTDYWNRLMYKAMKKRNLFGGLGGLLNFGLNAATAFGAAGMGPLKALANFGAGAGGGGGGEGQQGMSVTPPPAWGQYAPMFSNAYDQGY